MKKPIGRPKCRWEDNIKMDLKELCSEDVDWIVLAQDRDTVMKFGFRKMRGNS
jgi:hypothetical protein